MSGIDRVITAMLGQHGHMFGWVPVRLAVGIGIYFFHRFEPVTPLHVGAGILGGTDLLFAKRFGEILPHCYRDLFGRYLVFNSGMAHPLLRGPSLGLAVLLCY